MIAAAFAPPLETWMVTLSVAYLVFRAASRWARKL